MREIISAQNSTVKQLSLLKDKKGREQAGLYLIEGEKLVADAMDCGMELELVIASTDYSGGRQALERVQGSSALLLSAHAFAKLTSDKSPQGIIAAIKLPRNAFRQPDGCALLLDGISDPGNLGTIVRTAAACGYSDVYLLDCTDAYSARAVRAAMGGTYRVNIFKIDGAEAESLCSKQMSICADMSGEGLFGASVPSKHMLVIGSERAGVREPLKAAAKLTLSLPMPGGAESLNAGVAASVMMYHLKFGQAGAAADTGGISHGRSQ